MDWTGGCLCGAVRYRATAEPLRAMICHCATCRRVSGSAFLSFVHFPKDSFTWVSGEPARYRSSTFAERGFCSDCGSTLSMHETEEGRARNPAAGRAMADHGAQGLHRRPVAHGAAEASAGPVHIAHPPISTVA